MHENQLQTVTSMLLTPFCEGDGGKETALREVPSGM